MSPINLISIVGAGHSGSTLLDLVLGAHPKIWSIGEINNWEQYVNYDNDNKVCSCGSPPESCDFWSPIVVKWREYLSSRGDSNSLIDTRTLSVKGTINLMRHRLCLLLTLLFPMHKHQGVMNSISPDFKERANSNLALFKMIRTASDRPILCDSSKSVYRFRLLHAQNPETAKAIFLTRDGRAIAASQLKRCGTEPSKSAKNWRFTNLYTKLMLRTLPKNSYLHVRYEELCREPEATLERICSFIGCTYDPKMLDFDDATRHNIGGNRMRMTTVREIREDLKWREAFSDAQLTAFNKVAGKLNTKLLGNYYQP